MSQPHTNSVAHNCQCEHQTEKKKKKQTDYYKHPRSDISSLASHLVQAEKEKYELQQKNKEYQDNVFKLVNLLDKSSDKKDYYQVNYKRSIHQLDYYSNFTPIMCDFISNLAKKSKYNFKDNCSICLLELGKANETILVTSCNHLFHRDCITRSLSSIHNRCPNCRSRMILLELCHFSSQKKKMVIEKPTLYVIMAHQLEKFSTEASGGDYDSEIEDSEYEFSDVSSVPDEDENTRSDNQPT